MARKLHNSASDSASDSSLSPFPEELRTPVTVADSDNLPVKSAVNEKKRKAEVTVKTTKTTKRARKTAVKEEADETDQDADKSKKRARKVKVEEETVGQEVKVEANGTTIKAKTTQKRKKKEGKIEPLEERTQGSKLRVGAHVSIAGGVHNAIANVLHIGANAFALFLKNQRKWTNPSLDLEHATLFLDGCKEHNIEAGDCCLPHGSYLVNLAHPDEDRKKQAYDSFHDDLTRCHKLGIKLYNFHPGNANATTRENGIKLIAEAINKAHNDPATGEVIPLLETMASLGNTIGGTFEDLAAIIDQVENKNRVGVCLDTCHVFAAGYDLRTPEAYAATMAKFDEIIGFKYLKAFHVNDSKAPLASYRDLHARIGTGYLGLRSFHNIVNDERLHGLPMVLETPIDIKDENGKKIEDKSIWAREIKMLEKLVGMDVESEGFKKWEADLFEEGKGERERIGGQVKRKQDKGPTPKKKRGKKKVESEVETEDDED
ncbi:AP endonuclease [Lentithecium fluviatile CBS 122367]|uniref:Apurinic-apyrimidinic endonuclease 1 n=1 Tax=Lentithecium fluviatile CBS 122367 TaxID=1168545 RepID=A0A6G1JBZ8_9PLEO|nr:AP endonuclease [Lentithecium fluviatile CBS 122367]